MRATVYNIFVLLLFIFSASGSFAVVEGIEILDRSGQPSTLSPYVSLSFELKGLIADPCSATYLGNGKILTAAHCFLLNVYDVQDPNICIQDYAGTKKVCVHKNDYEVFFPPLIEQGFKAPTRKIRSVIRIPKPDLAVLVLKEHIREQLPNFETINVTTLTSTNFDLTQKFKLVGQGCTGYIVPPGEMPSGMGLFRIADVVLTPVQSILEFNSIWTDTIANGGVCWGDSGGPLMIMDPTQKLTQIAVVSSMKSRHNKSTGLTSMVTSTYTRLDHPVVQDWLKKQILPR